MSSLLEDVARAALRRGTFTLASGRQSDVYVDKWALLTQPWILRRIAEELVYGHLPRGITLAAGVELGGVPLVTAISREADLDALIVRRSPKPYGTGNQIEGRYAPGQRVVLVEDVLTTGGSAIRAATGLRDAGLVVAQVLAIVDREEGAAEALAEAGLPYRALWTLRELKGAMGE